MVSSSLVSSVVLGSCDRPEVASKYVLVENELDDHEDDFSKEVY